MRKYIYMMAAALVLLVSCQEKVEFMSDLTLSSSTVKMPAAEGWHVIAVYANNPWTAGFSEPVDWASLDVIKGGDGLGRIRLDCRDNYGLKRAVDVVVTDGSLSDTLHVVQNAGLSEIEFSFKESSVEVPADRARVKTAFKTNLRYDIGRAVISVKDTADEPVEWISDVEIGMDAVTFTVSQAEEDRMAVITLTLTDCEGTMLETSLLVNQKCS